MELKVIRMSYSKNPRRISTVLISYQFFQSCFRNNDIVIVENF